MSKIAIWLLSKLPQRLLVEAMYGSDSLVEVYIDGEKKDIWSKIIKTDG